MGQHTAPLPTLTNEHVGLALMLSKRPPLIHAARNSARRDYGGVTVDSYGDIFRLHHLVAKRASPDQREERCLVAAATVGPDDDPVLSHESADGFDVVLDHRVIPLTNDAA